MVEGNRSQGAEVLGIQKFASDAAHARARQAAEESDNAVILNPSAVILSPFAVILSAAKDLALALRVKYGKKSCFVRSVAISEFSAACKARCYNRPSAREGN
jgi:hypothetical protein